jgi:hypothetical protein
MNIFQTLMWSVVQQRVVHKVAAWMWLICGACPSVAQAPGKRFSGRCVIEFNWLPTSAALPTVHIQPAHFRVVHADITSIIKVNQVPCSQAQLSLQSLRFARFGCIQSNRQTSRSSYREIWLPHKRPCTFHPVNECCRGGC